MSNITSPSPEAIRARTVLLGRSRWGVAEIIFWVLAFACYWLFPTKLSLLSEIAILGLVALSVDLVLGYAGIVTLGQGAFFGIGAYAAGLAAKHGMGTTLWSDPVIGLFIGGGAAAVIGFATSFLVLRGSDMTRLMVTLGVALIVDEVVNQMKWLTGGSDGLQGVLPSAVLGIWEFDLFGRVAFVYSMVVLFVLFVIARALVKSPFGLSLQAIKGNMLRTRAIGMPVNARLVAVYTVAAFYAGVAGALAAQTTQFASPDYVAFHRSADAMLMLVFGGAGHLYGGLLGSIIFRTMQDVLGNITPQYWQFWLGVTLVALVLFVRGGILGLLGKFRFQWKPSPFSSFRHLFTQRFVVPLRAAVLFLILIFAVIFLLQSSAVSFGFQLGIGFTLAVLLVGFLAFQLATQKGRQALRNFISKFINKGGAS